jgi:hypothetical protein
MVVLGARGTVAGGMVRGGKVFGGRVVEGAVVVVGREVVTGGCAGLEVWLPLLEPQAERPNTTAVTDSTTSLTLEPPAAR